MFDFTNDNRPKLAIKDIVIKTDRARKDFSKVMDLKQSIEENGLIQPIVVNKDESGKYILIAGETRVKACMCIPEMNGLIPFTFFENQSLLECKIKELEENLRRENLSWIEQITCHEQIDTLKRELLGDQTKQNPDGWSVKKTADMTGISPGFASQQINFSKKLKARPDIKERVKNLPLKIAMKVAEQIEGAEATDRLAKAGEIQLTTELENTNALLFLAKQASSSINLYLFDPPFGLDDIESGREGEQGSNQSYKGRVKDSDNSTRSSVLTLLDRVFFEIARTLKEGCHFYMFCDLELFGNIQQSILSHGLEINYPLLIWDKCRTTTAGNGYNYMSSYEAIIYGHKPPNQRRLNENSSNIIKCPALHSSKKIHIFEKPLELLAGFIKRSTNYGDTVCDPFAGSGSTLLAARQCGRKALGCELDKENYLSAQARLLMDANDGHKTPS